jgi:aerobic-type carbon monoxide dehydrogenase small subunit (CoxS/CutS family)
MKKLVVLAAAFAGLFLGSASATNAADSDLMPTKAPVLTKALPAPATATKLSAGLCGACTVHQDGNAVRSCQVALSEVGTSKIVTIEGLDPESQHPIQLAWIAEQVPMCGYCQSGQIMQAAALLAQNRSPSDDDITNAMDGNLCRCMAAKADPLEFRLNHLDGAGKQSGVKPNSAGGAKRLAAVLQEAVRRSGYGRTKLAPDSAFGIAATFGQERDMPTFTACVAQVAAERTSGLVSVRKLTVVSDVGRAVNPDGVLSQMQSATLWGLSVALYEQGTFKDSAIDHENFDSYTPLRMSQVPELDVSFMPSTEYPVGIGEPPMTAVAPAIGNAIFRAVGARVRSLPIAAEKVKQAIPA